MATTKSKGCTSEADSGDSAGNLDELTESNLRDREIIRKLIYENDGTGTDELVRKHSGWVLSLCCRKTGSKENGEDVAQRTWTGIFRRFEKVRKAEDAVKIKFVEPMIFSKYLYRAAENQIITFQRIELRNLWPTPPPKIDADGELVDPIENTPSPDPPPDDITSDARLLLALHHCLELLPRDQRIITSGYYNEVTQEEIGKKLGCGRSNVCQQLKKALKTLKKCLSEAGWTAQDIISSR